jgi:RNA polymerase sigma-70 factor (ECF subfamily)
MEPGGQEAGRDGDLLRLWQSGDAGAADSLLDRHFPALLRFFNNKAPGAVEDLVQETLLECVRSVERFRGASSFRTFLFGIAHNVLRRHYRRRSRDGLQLDTSVASVADLGGLGERPRSPSSLVGAAQHERLLLAALRRIPIDAQVLLELKYWEDLSSSEIAEILQVPPVTVRRRQMKARERLHAEIERLASSPQVAASTIEGFQTWVERVRSAAPG